MSEEPAQDVSPLRLKRPAAPGFQPPAPPAPEAQPTAAPASPEPPSGGSQAPRRRPTLSLNKEPATPAEPVASAPPAPPAPTPQPTSSEPAAPGSGIKLRVGAKPPLPPPPTPAELPDPLAELGEISGPPLIPIPSLPPLGTGATAAPFASAKPATPPPLPTPPPFAPVIGAAPSPIAPPVPAPFPPVAPPLTVLNAPPPPLSKHPVAAGKPLMPGTAQFQQAKNLQRSRRPILLFAVGISALCGVLYFYLSPNAEKPAAPPVPVVAKPKPTPTAPPPDTAPVQPQATVVAPPVVSTAITPPTTPPAAVTPPPAPTLPPAPSNRFVRYAEGLGPAISGVFQGSPARALIGGKLVRVGDEIDSALGVKFVGVDADTKHLLFEDRTGAQVRVKY
ncbi:MAG: hypothetical protein NTU80_07245 [Verrucomicrobia bacterium]|nr:hypothetical protein [Verrucomicrobiota bacterium]